MDNNIKFWERFAKLYTPIQEKSNQKLYNEVCKECAKYIDKSKKVLELACGTGQFTFPLCDRAGEWIATDFSPNMIKELKKQGNKNFNCAVEDATKLTYLDDSFDVVLIANALHIMPEPEKALNEIHRVLKLNGILLAPTFIYNGHENKLRLWFMNKAGFRTFHKWNENEYKEFLKQCNFEILESKIYESDLLPEAFVASKTI